MRNIKYLIKFVSNEEIADRLIKNGELYMRSAYHYVELERKLKHQGQGDIREGMIFDVMWTCMNYPIYCMYAVFDDEIEDGNIIINKKNIKDFCGKDNGFLVLISYEDFCKRLNPDNFNGYALKYGLIDYLHSNFEYDRNIFDNDPCDALFKKIPDFEHQNEFRIVCKKSLQTLSEDYLIYDTYIPYLGSIETFSSKHNINELKRYKDYRLSLKYNL